MTTNTSAATSNTLASYNFDDENRQHSKLTKAFPAVRKINTLFTLRGILVFTLMCYFVTGPVARNADIVASVLSYFLLSVEVILLVSVLLVGSYLRRKTLVTAAAIEQTSKQLDITDSELSGEALAKTVVQLNLAPCNIPPLLQLQVQLLFTQRWPESSIHTILGRSSKPRTLSEIIEFPHRGVWQVERVRLRVCDQLGLCTLDWEQMLSNPFQIRIRPASAPLKSFPPRSSSVQAGDSLPDNTERTGDPFDLKPYQPGDDLRKIAWKIFARSGELVSRHPEPLVNPEGQTAILCYASLYEDAVGYNLNQYLETLEESAIEYFVGCEGADLRSPARNREAFKQDFINSAWRTSTSTTESILEEVQNFFDGINANLRGAVVKKVLVFCGSRRLQNPSFESAYISLGDSIRQNGADPIFCIANSTGDSTQIDLSKSNFIQHCARNNWEVLL